MTHRTERQARHTWVDDAVAAAQKTESQLAAAYPRVGRRGYNVPTSHGRLLARIGTAILELSENDQTTLRSLQHKLYLKKLREFVAVGGRPTTLQERKTIVRIYAARYSEKNNNGKQD